MEGDRVGATAMVRFGRISLRDGLPQYGMHGCISGVEARPNDLTTIVHRESAAVAAKRPKVGHPIVLCP